MPRDKSKYKYQRLISEDQMEKEISKSRHNYQCAYSKEDIEEFIRAMNQAIKDLAPSPEKKRRSLK
jgi:hypothetical protein